MLYLALMFPCKHELPRQTLRQERTQRVPRRPPSVVPASCGPACSTETYAIRPYHHSESDAAVSIRTPASAARSTVISIRSRS